MGTLDDVRHQLVYEAGMELGSEWYGRYNAVPG
jgi:hypothetical protein